ncbi:MAG TPA: hypothetical protein VIP48_23835 [Streptosporangiaceae bacterium]
MHTFGKITAALGAAAIAGGTALGILSAGAASAATKPAWFMTAGNIQSLSQLDSATAAHFFNTSSSYGAGASLIKTPVQYGYATTPVLNYTSYAKFSSDLASGAIKYPYKWVMYDPENWASTPATESQDPVTYLKLFGQLAHAHGLKVVEAPSLDLCSVSGTLYPRQPGENCVQWYGRVNIAGASATSSDIYVLQDESNTANLSQYMSLYASSASQARAANSTVNVYSEVSTANGTPDQMTAAAKSISPDGFYVAAPGAIPQVDQFFQNMRAAGY